MTAMKGRVVVCRQYRKPFDIEEYEVPPLDPGAILLRTAQSGVCGSDLHTWRGDQEKAPLPKAGKLMGHEGFATIDSLGKGVKTDSLGQPLHEGDRVVYSALFPCYHCRHCLKGNTAFCLDRPVPVAGVYPYFTATYADYMYLPPRHPIFKAPDSLPDEVLAPVNCATGTVMQGLRSAGAREGHTVVIQGAGGLGLTATAVAKDLGAHQVIVLDRLENRLQLAEEFGADHTINVEEFNTPEARVGRVKELTHGRGADIVMELVGRAELMAEGLQMLDNTGTFLEIGDIVPGRTVAIDPSTLLKGKRIVGSLMYPAEILPLALDFLERNVSRRPFHKIVSHKFKLADVNKAFEQAEWNARQTAVTRAVLVP
ncbi:MAG: zinc-binding dehydrogenase [SAR202 cluster bacterium]|nr:zinc-binding dehydrogenase [SAR202 cluster bacterium]